MARANWEVRRIEMDRPMRHTCPHCGGEFAEAILSDRPAELVPSETLPIMECSACGNHQRAKDGVRCEKCGDGFKWGGPVSEKATIVLDAPPVTTHAYAAPQAETVRPSKLAAAAVAAPHSEKLPCATCPNSPSCAEYGACQLSDNTPALGFLWVTIAVAAPVIQNVVFPAWKK